MFCVHVNIFLVLLLIMNLVYGDNKNDRSVHFVTTLRPVTLKNANYKPPAPVNNNIHSDANEKYPPSEYTESIFLPIAPHNYHPDKTHEALQSIKPTYGKLDNRNNFNILDFNAYIVKPITVNYSQVIDRLSKNDKFKNINKAFHDNGYNHNGNRDSTISQNYKNISNPEQNLQNNFHFNNDGAHFEKLISNPLSPSQKDIHVDPKNEHFGKGQHYRHTTVNPHQQYFQSTTKKPINLVQAKLKQQKQAEQKSPLLGLEYFESLNRNNNHKEHYAPPIVPYKYEEDPSLKKPDIPFENEEHQRAGSFILTDLQKLTNNFTIAPNDSPQIQSQNQFKTGEREDEDEFYDEDDNEESQISRYESAADKNPEDRQQRNFEQLKNTKKNSTPTPITVRLNRTKSTTLQSPLNEDDKYFGAYRNQKFLDRSKPLFTANTNNGAQEYRNQKYLDTKTISITTSKPRYSNREYSGGNKNQKLIQGTPQKHKNEKAIVQEEPARTSDIYKSSEEYGTPRFLYEEIIYFPQNSNHKKRSHEQKNEPFRIEVYDDAEIRNNTNVENDTDGTIPSGSINNEGISTNTTKVYYNFDYIETPYHHSDDAQEAASSRQETRIPFLPRQPQNPNKAAKHSAKYQSPHNSYGLAATTTTATHFLPTIRSDSLAEQQRVVNKNLNNRNHGIQKPIRAYEVHEKRHEEDRRASEKRPVNIPTSRPKPPPPPPPSSTQRQSPRQGPRQGEVKYFQFANVLGKGMYNAGVRKGNDDHFVEKFERNGNGMFQKKVRWGDKKGGYGEHIWDLNHHQPDKSVHMTNM